MADPSQRQGRRRWPYHGRAQIVLPLTGLVLGITGFLPWLDTAFGAAYLGQVPQLCVLSAGAVGLAGALWRRRGAVIVHAGLTALVGVGVVVWYLGAALTSLPDLGQAWVPGPGAVLALLAGGVATWAWTTLVRGQVAGAARPADG